MCIICVAPLSTLPVPALFLRVFWLLFNFRFACNFKQFHSFKRQPFCIVPRLLGPVPLGLPAMDSAARKRFMRSSVCAVCAGEQAAALPFVDFSFPVQHPQQRSK